MAARSAQDLEEILASSRAGFTLKRVPMAAATQWAMTEGALQHMSKGFFSVIGVDYGGADGPGMFLYQPQGAVTGILTARVDGARQFLLQARAEPGCLGEAQFGPSVQSTPANYMKQHGGAATAHVNAFIEFGPASLYVKTQHSSISARAIGSSLSAP